MVDLKSSGSMPSLNDKLEMSEQLEMADNFRCMSVDSFRPVEILRLIVKIESEKNMFLNFRVLSFMKQFQCSVRFLCVGAMSRRPWLFNNLFHSRISPSNRDLLMFC